MFNKTIIKAAAAGLIGFNYSTHQFYKYLTTSYKSSSSGYWINSLQGADMSVIEATQPSEVKNIDLIVGERYVIRSTGGTFTNVGAADNNVGTTFVATGTTPTAWGSAYLELQSCNKYISTIYEEEIVNLATKFISNSKRYLKQNTLLSNHSVMGGVADMSKTITKKGRFVGFVLNPHEGNNIVNTITKVGWLGDTADSGLKLYLYETSQEDAIATFEFNYTTPLSQQWKDITNFIIKYDNTRTISTGQGSNVTSYSNSNTESISAGVTKQITFDSAFTDTDYALNITVYDSSGVAQDYTVTDRLSTGFKINAAVDLTVDYVAIKTVTDTYSANTYSGGIGQKYILGYFEDDLSSNAIGMEFNQSLKNFSIFGKYMAIYPVAIPSTKLNGVKLPSNILNISSYLTDTTHGLYFKFTANCDYTNLIEDNIDLFAEPLQYAVAIRILQDAVSSVGDGVHNSVKDSALPEWRKLIAKYSGELNGGYINIGDRSQFKKGLVQLLTLDFSNIDSVCFKSDFRHDWNVGNLI